MTFLRNKALWKTAESLAYQWLRWVRRKNKGFGDWQTPRRNRVWKSIHKQMAENAL